jgi:hypothetical protein
MGGKVAIIYVVGFAVLLGYVSTSLNTIANRSQGNVSTYAASAESHNLAITGANAGLARLYQDTSWRGTQTQTLSNAFHGSFTYTAMNGPGGLPMLRSISRVSGPDQILQDTVEVLFGGTGVQSFSLFAWMSNFEGNVFWITGDTVWGRVHSNGMVHMSGTPTFMEKVTTSKGIDPKPGTGGNDATFKKGFETGVAEIQFPIDLSAVANAAKSGGRSYTGNVQVKLFGGTSASGDGYALVYSGATKIDSIFIGSGSFNGVIGATGNVDVSGTLDGKLSVYSANEIGVVNDILYEDRTSGSDDILGLVAEKSVVVADNTANASDCHIDASIFVRSGSFGAEDYNKGGTRGRLYINGSIVQDTRGAVGTFSGSKIKTGYLKSYTYDQRLSDPTFRPPFYPGFFTQTYSISSWWESVHVPRFD